MSILKTQFSFTKRKISSKDLSKRPFRISASASGRLLSQAYGERQRNPYISKDIRKKSVQPTKLKGMGRATWSRYTYLQDRPPIQARGAHVHHAVAWHSGGWSVINVVRFKDDFTLRWHGNSITISQGQCFVIVENTVEIFDPDSIDWSV